MIKDNNKDNNNTGRLGKNDENLDGKKYGFGNGERMKKNDNMVGNNNGNNGWMNIYDKSDKKNKKKGGNSRVGESKRNKIDGRGKMVVVVVVVSEETIIMMGMVGNLKMK